MVVKICHSHNCQNFFKLYIVQHTMWRGQAFLPLQQLRKFWLDHFALAMYWHHSIATENFGLWWYKSFLVQFSQWIEWLGQHHTKIHLCLYRISDWLQQQEDAEVKCSFCLVCRHCMLFKFVVFIVLFEHICGALALPFASTGPYCSASEVPSFCNYCIPLHCFLSHCSYLTTLWAQAVSIKCWSD